MIIVYCTQQPQHQSSSLTTAQRFSSTYTMLIHIMSTHSLLQHVRRARRATTRKENKKECIIMIFFAPRARKVLFRPPVIWRKVTPAGGKVVFSPAPTQNQEGGKAVFSPAPTQNALGAKSFVQPSGGKCIFSPLSFLGTRSTRTQKPPRARKCIFRPRAVNSYNMIL